MSEREDLFTYYAGQDEGQRLFRFPHNRLELLRTRELLQRQLPSPPAVVLDVGGGTGVHAAWLADRGYGVHLVDLVPGHVRAALEHGRVTAEVGGARRLSQADGSVDAVLLLGPLYHLVGRPNGLRRSSRHGECCGPAESSSPRPSDGSWRSLTGRRAAALPPTSQPSWCQC